MAQTTLRVKNGIITLPKKTRENWRNANVFVRVSRDTVVLKKIQPSSFWQTWRKMKRASKQVTKKDVGNAVSWARRKSGK